MRRRHARAGFTLIELTLVMVILSILALIVTPRVLRVIQQGREAQLHTHLHSLRNSLGVFFAQCGDYPGQLEDLTASSAVGLTGASGNPIDPVGFKGPYFTASPTGELPVDPMTHARNWSYHPATGEVHSGSPGTALDGTTYDRW